MKPCIGKDFLSMNGIQNHHTPDYPLTNIVANIICSLTRLGNNRKKGEQNVKIVAVQFSHDPRFVHTASA